jgi:uncharacterized membrane protein
MDEHSTRPNYIELIGHAINPAVVLDVVNDFLIELHRLERLPEVPTLPTDLRVQTTRDVYYWLGALISQIQVHACELSPETLVAIHVTLQSAVSRLKALGCN